MVAPVFLGRFKVDAYLTLIAQADEDLEHLAGRASMTGQMFPKERHAKV